MIFKGVDLDLVPLASSLPVDVALPPRARAREPLPQIDVFLLGMIAGVELLAVIVALV